MAANCIDIGVFKITHVPQKGNVRVFLKSGCRVQGSGVYRGIWRLYRDTVPP